MTSGAANRPTSRRPRPAAAALTDAPGRALIDRWPGLLSALQAGLPLLDDDWPDDSLAWDRSPDLRQASKLADREATRAEGLARLEQLAVESPMSAAPVVLRARALAASADF